ncbi:MAG: hypothetical protein QOJ69_199, partial [Actinomycetota bacterium]|nr:hypothetical protein [Actinomycetota bacterium]
MGASVVLSPETISVAPGSMATATVRVRNDGSVVDVFAIDVVGEASGWATVEPPSVNLFPGAQGNAVVRFEPPRSTAVTAGAKPFGVRVRSQEDPGFSVVEEGVVQVEPFTELGATLVPQTVETSGSARSRVRVVNAGNVPAGVTLRAQDPDEALAATVSPPSLHLVPGQEATAQVSLRPRERFLRGPTRSRPYTVVVDDGSPEPLTANGTLVQKPVIAAGWVKAATAVLALGIAAAIFLVATRKGDQTINAAPAGSSQTTADRTPGTTVAGGGSGGGGASSTVPGGSTSMATSTTAAGATARPIVYASLRNGPDSDIWSIRPDGNGLKALTSDGTDETDPALSPDGKKVLYVGDADGDNEIYVMNVDGSGRKQLTDNQAEDVAPAWSPDGKKIAWASGATTSNLQLSVMNASGDGKQPITGGQVDKASDPSWSPDGQRIAFTAYRTATNPEIAVVDSDGTGFTYLTNNTAQDLRPAWGKTNRLAFESNRTGGNYDVWVMEPTGTGATRLTDSPAYDGSPAWSEKGTDIAFVSDRLGAQRLIWLM